MDEQAVQALALEMIGSHVRLTHLSLSDLMCHLAGVSEDLGLQPDSDAMAVLVDIAGYASAALHLLAGEIGVPVEAVFQILTPDGLSAT